MEQILPFFIFVSFKFLNKEIPFNSLKNGTEILSGENIKPLLRGCIMLNDQFS